MGRKIINSTKIEEVKYLETEAYYTIYFETNSVSASCNDPRVSTFYRLHQTFLELR